MSLQSMYEPFVYASNNDHEHGHGYESGMNRGYGREGMKNGDDDMKDMEEMSDMEGMEGITKIKDI